MGIMENKKSLILISIFSLIFFLFGFNIRKDCPDYQKGIEIREQIMSIDNKIILDSAEGSELCSQSIEAILNNDLNKIKNATAQVIILTDDINKLDEQKAKLLLQLKK